MSQGTEQLFKLLAEVNPKESYGTALFDALTRLTVTVAVEAVCLRHTTTEIEVFLVQRSPSETAYPGEWHCPGSATRPGEREKDVLDRLEKKEFGGKLLTRKFVGNCNIPEEARGHFFDPVYLCTLGEAEGLRGKWFPVNDLPEPTVGHHRNHIIPMAVEAFRASS